MLRFISVFLLVLGSFACQSTGLPVVAPPGSVAVLARVDGVPIAAEAYQVWLGDMFGAKQRQDYISLWLLEREAQRKGILVSTAEIDAAREALLETWVRDRLNGDPQALDAELARQGQDRQGFQRRFFWEKRRELLATRLIRAERVVGEDALIRRFEQQYGPGGVLTSVRLLVLTRARLSLELSKEPGARTMTAAELDERLLQAALDLRARASAGETFEALTRAESNDLAVRKNGGVFNDAQWRLRGAAFVRSVEAAPVGSVQLPVPNASGIDLFEVLDRKTTRLDDVRAALTLELQAAPPSLEEISELDQRLRSQSVIELN